MDIRLSARSISRPVQDMLRQQPFSARVLASFRQACDLVTPAGDVLALVSPQIGDGPLNIVVKGRGAVWPSAGIPTGLVKGHLHIGSVIVDLTGATVWEPCPDWTTLRAHQAAAAQQLPRLQAIGRRCASSESLLQFVPTGAPDQICPLQSALEATVREAAAMLWAGWEGDMEQMKEAASRLAGLGGGLTPAGDDFLAGVMLWAWYTHPSPADLCQVLAETATPRTTTLSAALLRAAAKGQCSNPWQQLLAILASGHEDELESATRQVLAHGATSGGDTLAGFLWAGHKQARPICTRARHLPQPIHPIVG